MKSNYLKKLKKYNQSFFNSFNNKTLLKRYYHRLKAWYILNYFSNHINHNIFDTLEYQSIDDKSLFYFLKYLSKYTNLNKTVKTFPNLKSVIELRYQTSDYKQIKYEILYGCKLCPNCSKRLKHGYKFCSSKCANEYKLKDPNFTRRISESLKKYYKVTDNTKRYLKIKDTVNKMYQNMTPEEIKHQCTNKNIAFTAYNNFSKNFPSLTLECSEKFFYTNKYIPIKCQCGNRFIGNKSTAFYPYCKRCNPSIKHKVQNDILEFIQSFINETLSTDTRTIIPPLELDIFIPSKKIAIEYDGLIWHSFGISKYSKFNTFKKEDKNIHLIKTQKCHEKGINLLHIFENEWLNPIKKKIWKSVIISKMGNTKRIFARKCTIKLISSKSSTEFLESNHLQGSCFASINIGLFYKDDLVQVITLSKSRFSKKYEYELLRMCSKINTTVVGGASKLMKYFERTYKPKSIVSYANMRWSDGNVYEKLGFQFSHDSSPNYFYFKVNENVLYSRNKFQKHKLKNILEIYDKNLSETENMYRNNFRKIYDCGNKVFYKKYKNL